MISGKQRPLRSFDTFYGELCLALLQLKKDLDQGVLIWTQLVLSVESIRRLSAMWYSLVMWQRKHGRVLRFHIQRQGFLITRFSWICIICSQSVKIIELDKLRDYDSLGSSGTYGKQGTGLLNRKESHLITSSPKLQRKPPFGVIWSKRNRRKKI